MKAQKAAGGKWRKPFAAVGAVACAAALSSTGGLFTGIRAAENPDADITALTVQTAVLERAEDFTVTVSLDELPDTGISALDFAIAYDPAVLTIDNVNLLYDTGAEAAEILVNPDFAGTVFRWENEDGMIRVRWGTGLRDPEFWLREERPFFTVSGHFGENAGAGSGSGLKIVPPQRESGETADAVTAGYLDEAGNPHVCETRLTNGGVFVVLDETGATRYGDINLDGDITTADAILLYRVLAEQSAISAAAYANADCEFDGVLTIADVSLMLRVINGDLEAKALGAH